MRKWITLFEDAKLDVRPSRDDLGEVSAANATHGFVGRSGWAAINQLNGGADMSDPKEKERVERLKAALSGPNGYIERIIIDGVGNVVEGQHRFSAMQQLGWEQVPVSQIIDTADHVDTEVIKAVEATGLSEDRAAQVVTNVLEEWYEDGDDGEGNYNSMGGWAKAFNAALDGIRAQGGPKDIVPVS